MSLNLLPANVSPRRFRLLLAGFALIALAARLAYARRVGVPEGGDAIWYHLVADGLADGRGFSDPYASRGPRGEVFGATGEPIPTAFHLPLFPAALSLGSLLGATSVSAHQALGCAFGAGTVAVIGLVGRRLAGERLGLIAAGLAAVYLPLIANEASLMSESLYGLLIALTLLAAFRYHSAPSRGNALLLGLAIGAASLTRSEAVLLLVLLAAPVTLGRPERWKRLALVSLAVAVCTVPWAVRNSLTFDEPVLLTTGDGSVLAGANLPSTYSGRFMGAWDPIGLFRTPAGRSLVRNEAVQSRRWREDAFEYAADHLGRVPLVVAVRVMRTWSIFPLAPGDKVDFAADVHSHIRGAEWISLLSFLAVLCLAVPGLLELRRRGAVPLSPFLAPIALVTLISAAGYGDTRFRQAAEVALVLLAAVTLDRLLVRRRTGVLSSAAGA